MAERLPRLLVNRYYDREGEARIRHRIPDRRISRLKPTFAEQELSILEGKQRFAEIATQYPHAILDRSNIEKDLAFVRPGIFAKPRHAVVPYHEARHIDSVYLLGEMLAGTVEDMQAQKPVHERLPIDRSALSMATRTHDVPRFFARIFEPLESIPVMNQLHGRMASVLLPRWFTSADSKTLEIAQRAVQYHDRHHTPIREQNPTLELLVIADRLELVRLLNDRFYGSAPILKDKFSKRMSDYNAVYFPQLSEMFKPVSNALYLLTIQRLNAMVEEAKKTGQHVTFDDQRKALLDSAEALGIVRSKVPSTSL